MNKFEYKLLGKSVGFSNILEGVLENRGIDNIPLFLNPTEEVIESIELYDNIDNWIDTYLKHINNNSNICLIVDADLDGFTSASIMYQYTKMLNPNIEIISLFHEGKKHGISDLIEEIKKLDNIDLLLVPDAGSNDIEEHKQLKELGIDILIADHHDKQLTIIKDDKEIDLKEEDFTNAIIVNNQFSNRVTNKTLTGVGVCYKIIKEIDKRLSINYADMFLDLVAVGMIADMSDLHNLESRYFVLKGIELMDKKQGRNLFLKALIEKQSFSMRGMVNIINVAFYISPLINAVTRMGTIKENRMVFEAMRNINRIVTDKVRGKGEVEMSLQDYAIRICEKVKRKQKKETDNGVKQIKEQINKFNLDKNSILVCNGEDLSPSLSGLVANKLRVKYQKPCIVLRNKDMDTYGGSARGYEKSGIKDFKQWCLDSKLFEKASGHSNAFGVEISTNNINKLYESISAPIDNTLIYEVDAIINSNSLNSHIISLVDTYKNIWGCSIDEPLFAITNLIVPTDCIHLKGKNNTTISFTNENNIDFITFDSNEEIYEDMVKDKKSVEFTIIGRFSVNNYMGTSKPQVIIQDMKYKTVNNVFRF